MRIAIDRNLAALHVSGRAADDEIGQRHVIAEEEPASGQAIVQQIGQGPKTFFGTSKLGLVGHSHPEHRLAHILVGEDVDHRRPGSCFPEQPARDVGADFGICREERRFAGAIGQVLADRVRLPQHQVAVAQCRHLAHRIDGEIVGMAVLTLVQPNQGMLDLREAEMGDDGGCLAGVGGRRKGVKLHDPLPYWVLVEFGWSGAARPTGAALARRLRAP